MNYLSLINQFWAKDLEHFFTPNDIAVYFRLLERCNALGWKNPFNFSVDELLMKLRLKTKDPLDTARNRLKQAGLIDFRNGQGRGHTTTYWLVSGEAENPDEKGQKNTPFIPPFSPTFSPPFSPPTYPLVHKTKLNKTKEETANAVCEGEAGQDSDLAEEDQTASAPCRDRTGEEVNTSPEPANPPPEPTTPGKKGSKGRAAGRASPPSPPNTDLPLGDRWPDLVAQLGQKARSTWDRFVAWEQDNPLPKLFAMKEPLLPKQLVALIHKHGSGAVTGVLQDMQNKPRLLADYDSANLTAQSWLRRRQQQEKGALRPA